MSRARVYGAAADRSLTRFLEPSTLARIANLDLLSRTVVEGFISGLHHSPFFGRSLDFAEHRQYMPGDDIRLIDWKLFARTDRFYVKEFEADTNTNCTILLDVSRSMRFAKDSISKLDYGRYLSACLAYFAHKQRDRVGFAAFAGEVIQHVPPAAKHLEEVLRAIDRLEPGARDSCARRSRASPADCGGARSWSSSRTSTRSPTPRSTRSRSCAGAATT